MHLAILKNMQSKFREKISILEMAFKEKLLLLMKSAVIVEIKNLLFIRIPSLK
mgnify:CR=1 FL=1